MLLSVFLRSLLLLQEFIHDVVRQIGLEPVSLTSLSGARSHFGLTAFAAAGSAKERWRSHLGDSL